MTSTAYVGPERRIHEDVRASIATLAAKQEALEGDVQTLSGTVRDGFATIEKRLDSAFGAIRNSEVSSARTPWPTILSLGAIFAIVMGGYAIAMTFVVDAVGMTTRSITQIDRRVDALSERIATLEARGP